MTGLVPGGSKAVWFWIGAALVGVFIMICRGARFAVSFVLLDRAIFLLG